MSFEARAGAANPEGRELGNTNTINIFMYCNEIEHFCSSSRIELKISLNNETYG